jgi:mannitol-1-/sugar-/sorbitol-6-phosphatase
VTLGRVTIAGLRARGPGGRLRCRAVLFDLDGVLVDSTAVVERHWAAWADRHGVDLQAIRRAMHGRRSLDTIRQVAPHLDAVAEGLGVDQAQAADGDGVRAIPGAAALLDDLSGATWAVVTSGPGFLARARLGMAGLPEPRVVISGDTVDRGKPDPAAYEAAATALGLSPAACLVVEDAPAGVQAALAAGMRVVGVLTHHAPEELSGTECVVRDLRALQVVSADGDQIVLHPSPPGA